MSISRHNGAARTALAVLALIGVAGCAPVATFGWVWADQPTVASYTPNATHQYNSAANTNTVAHPAQGQYVVTFPRLAVRGGNVPPGQTGLDDGNVQVTAQGPIPGSAKATAG
jgi:hypothetical protein